MIGTKLRRWGATGLLAALAACGGGGGGGDGGTPSFSAAPSGPPVAAATMAATATDAVDVTKAAVAAADGAATRQNALSGFATLGGAVASGGPGVGFSTLVRAAGMKQAQAVTTDPCTAFFPQPCSGNVVTDTNIASNATSITRGQSIDGTFNALSGSLGGTAVTLSGRLRIEFLTNLNLNASSLAGVQLRLVFVNFSGSVAGQSFGPVNETMDLVFDAQAVATLVVPGASFGTLAGVTTTGPGAYSISSVGARIGYGTAAAGYVDVLLTGWTASGSRPANGFARVTVPGWSGSVSVVAATTSGVIYDVFITGSTPGSGGNWRVTATYPSNGGAPTYAAVAGN